VISLNLLNTIFLFIIEAIACNPKVYSCVDELYKKFTKEFQQCAIESQYYNHHVIKEKSLIQEEYAKKALGIFSLIIQHLRPDDKQYETFHNWLKELFSIGWAYEYTYAEAHKVINLELYQESLIKKRRGLKNVSSTTLYNSTAVLIFMAICFRREINMDDSLLKLIIHTMNSRLNIKNVNFNDQNCIRGDIALKVKDFNKRLYSLNCNIDTIDGIMDLASKYLPEEIVELILSPYGNMSLIDALNDCTLSKSQLEASLSTSIITMDKIGEDVDLLNKNFMLSFLYNSVISIFVRHYEEMKDFHNTTSDYATRYELEKSKSELKVYNEEIEKVKIENKKLKMELEKRDKEIKSLKNIVEVINTHKESIQKKINVKSNLCNEIVNQNIIEGYDIESMKDFHGLIVGGHPKCQEKMKKKMSKSIYLSSDDLNFDLNHINNADFICIDAKFMSHSMYEKVISKARKLNKKVIYLPRNTNSELNLNYIYKNLKS